MSSYKRVIWVIYETSGIIFNNYSTSVRKTKRTSKVWYYDFCLRNIKNIREEKFSSCFLCFGGSKGHSSEVSRGVVFN